MTPKEQPSISEPTRVSLMIASGVMWGGGISAITHAVQGNHPAAITDLFVTVLGTSIPLLPEKIKSFITKPFINLIRPKIKT